LLFVGFVLPSYSQSGSQKKNASEKKSAAKKPAVVETPSAETNLAKLRDEEQAQRSKLIAGLSSKAQIREYQAALRTF